ncbi:peptidylprolyl isomerase [Pararhodobacter sp. SW119]|uniref:peptidylprolyl isomerase n=1 Tax=Pararhodobacter sp. SW119 TaxID=2780075 RepID=UPI001ADF9C19|nr:peptidylprolyl isomerase [Pararhodobacter sp. SW119]
MKPLLPPIVVNGTTISAERIAAEAQNHPAPKGKPGHAWQAAARALALRELMLQEARARGFTPAPVEVAPGQIETEEEALVRQVMEIGVTPAPVDEAALRERYDAAPERFRSPTLYEAAHILIPVRPDDLAGKAQAKEQAEKLLAEVLARPDSFADLARRYSACSSRDAGGLLGQLTSGDTVPEFEAALEQLEEGQVAPAPVATRFGFHILRLDARARGSVLPFEAVLPRLRAAEEKVAWVRAARAFSERLIATADVSGIALKVA